MASISPLFFIHGEPGSQRVVRGSLKRRQSQHRMLVKAICYVGADGEDIGPAILDFTRVLGHEETFGNPTELLATLAAMPKRRSRK